MDIELVQLGLIFCKTRIRIKTQILKNGELGLTKFLKKSNQTKFSVQSGQLV